MKRRKKLERKATLLMMMKIDEFFLPLFFTILPLDAVYFPTLVTISANFETIFCMQPVFWGLPVFWELDVYECFDLLLLLSSS